MGRGPTVGAYRVLGPNRWAHGPIRIEFTGRALGPSPSVSSYAADRWANPVGPIELPGRPLGQSGGPLGHVSNPDPWALPKRESF